MLSLTFSIHVTEMNLVLHLELVLGVVMPPKKYLF